MNRIAFRAWTGRGGCNGKCTHLHTAYEYNEISKDKMCFI